MVEIMLAITGENLLVRLSNINYVSFSDWLDRGKYLFDCFSNSIENCRSICYDPEDVKAITKLISYKMDK